MKYFTHICLLFLLITPTWLLGQLPIVIHPPALSPTNPTVVDLLSGTLQNTRNNSYRIKLKVAITKNSIPTAGATSGAFDLEPGTLTIHSGNAQQLLTPVDGDYYVAEDRAYVERTGALPPGDYVICIDAIEDISEVLLGHTCYDHTVMDLNPPILVLPMNGEEITSPFPTFMWTPPTPLPDMPDYRLRIAPLLGNQSPVVAVGSNPAFHDVDGLLTTLYQYPLSARQFDAGAKYAWQVAVYKNGALITQSEIFTFSVGQTAILTWDTEGGGGNGNNGGGGNGNGGGNGSNPSTSPDKVLMIIGLEDRDTLVERVPQDLRFYKDNGRLTFSEQTYFTAPVTVYEVMDKDQRDMSQLIVFERVQSGLGYALKLTAPGNQSGQQYEYLNYVTPGGKVFNYKFRE